MERVYLSLRRPGDGELWSRLVASHDGSLQALQVQRNTNLGLDIVGQAAFDAARFFQIADVYQLKPEGEGTSLEQRIAPVTCAEAAALLDRGQRKNLVFACHCKEPTKKSVLMVSDLLSRSQCPCSAVSLEGCMKLQFHMCLHTGLRRLSG
jgi:hypothetical protein